MGRKRTLEQILELDFISIGELALLTETELSKPYRQSTLKFYSELGILRFEQQEEGLNRRFHRVNSLARLAMIRELIAVKHFSIEDVVTFFKKEDDKK